MIISKLCKTLYYFVLFCKTYAFLIYFYKRNQKQYMKTELKAIRIDKETIKFLKSEANRERRTFSGIVNKILKDYEDAKSKN